MLQDLIETFCIVNIDSLNAESEMGDLIETFCIVNSIYENWCKERIKFNRNILYCKFTYGKIRNLPISHLIETLCIVNKIESKGFECFF